MKFGAWCASFEFPVSSFACPVSIAVVCFDLGGESGDGGAEEHGGACANLLASIHTRLENVKRQGSPPDLGGAGAFATGVVTGCRTFISHGGVPIPSG